MRSTRTLLRGPMLAALVLAGCQGDSLGLGRGAPTLSVASAVVPASGTLRLQASNHSGDTFSYNACSGLEAERRTGSGEWTHALIGPFVRTCGLAMISLESGATAELDYPMTGVASAGEYRLRLRFERNDGATVVVRSNSFTIE